jgi:uncharacterized protein (UPF0335 family)
MDERTSNHAAMLQGYVERIEALHNERVLIANEISAVYRDAKSDGFNPKIIQEILRELRMKPDARSERYAALDAYREALGLFDTPPTLRIA